MNSKSQRTPPARKRNQEGAKGPSAQLSITCAAVASVGDTALAHTYSSLAGMPFYTLNDPTLIQSQNYLSLFLSCHIKGASTTTKARPERLVKPGQALKDWIIEATKRNKTKFHRLKQKIGIALDLTVLRV